MSTVTTKQDHYYILPSQHDMSEMQLRSWVVAVVCELC